MQRTSGEVDVVWMAGPGPGGEGQSQPGEVTGVSCDRQSQEPRQERP